MALGKWWLKHGPGSPGSIAKVMAKAFKSIQGRNPTLGRDEVLRQTLESRYALTPQQYSIPRDLRQRILENLRADKVLARASLVHLVVAVFISERYATGGYEDWLTAPVETKELAIAAIREVVSEYVPEEDRSHLDSRWARMFEKRMGFVEKWLSA